MAKKVGRQGELSPGAKVKSVQVETVWRPERLTDGIVRHLPRPPVGNRVKWDTDVRGFGCRVTAAGARTFVLNYRTRLGRPRRYTIGEFGIFSTGGARNRAAELKREVRLGEDPLGQLRDDRGAATVADLCTRFDAEHMPKTRPRTAAEYRAIIRDYIRPELGKLKVAEVAFVDVEAFHRKITARAPYRANRALAVLSKMLSLAVRWRHRADNPVKGVERNQERKRQRYLSMDELTRLTGALAAHKDVQVANIVRLLLLTGARRGEVLQARWDQFDLQSGIWIKPGATTKQKTDHRSPISAPVCGLLAEILAAAEASADRRGESVSEYVFPGRGGRGHRVEFKKDWAALCEAAGISAARVHDLRHTYASVLASSGFSLPVIGALLGHTQAATTARYTHLFDDPQRVATERAAAIIIGAGRQGADVLPLKGGGSK